MPVPVFSIHANGKDVTGNFAGIGVEMSITDGEGYKADNLTITLDDVDGSVEAPDTGAVLNPIGGYVGHTRDFGLYIVDHISYRGWPQQIIINAKSVAAKKAAKQREPKAYPKKDFPTYGDIFNDVAGRVGISLQMSSELKSIPNEYEAQAEEDGLEFLTRIGEKINAAVMVKSERLVAVVKGEGNSASGSPLPSILVARGFNLISYAVNEKDEPKHKEVEATYYERTKNARKTLQVSTGLDGPKLLLRNPFQNEDEAKRAAEAKAKELIRSQADAVFEIDGDPFSQAEALVIAQNIRSRVDGVWRAKVVTHKFSSSGPYTCSIECEKPNSGGGGGGGGGGRKHTTNTVSSTGPAPQALLGGDFFPNTA